MIGNKCLVILLGLYMTLLDNPCYAGDGIKTSDDCSVGSLLSKHGVTLRPITAPEARAILPSFLVDGVTNALRKTSVKWKIALGDTFSDVSNAELDMRKRQSQLAAAAFYYVNAANLIPKNTLKKGEVFLAAASVLTHLLRTIPDGSELEGIGSKDSISRVVREFYKKSALCGNDEARILVRDSPEIEVSVPTAPTAATPSGL